jgi:hypothetical protein
LYGSATQLGNADSKNCSKEDPEDIRISTRSAPIANSPNESSPYPYKMVSTADLANANAISAAAVAVSVLPDGGQHPAKRQNERVGKAM